MNEIFVKESNASQYLAIQNQGTKKILENPLLIKDVWHTVDDLKLNINEHSRSLTFDFRLIEQDWLRLLAKIFILLRINAKIAISTLGADIYHLRKFSSFLKEHSVEDPSQINEQVFEELDYYLKAQTLGDSSINNHYRVLTAFFNTCRLEKWLDVNTYWFRGRRKPISPLEINYLPEEVWNQLDQNLHYLPEPVQRMVLVTRTLGLRVGELCNLRFNCLRERDGQWRIRFETEKNHVEDELPIMVPELVAVIQEQQNYIRQHFGDSFNKLFCASSSKGAKGRNLKEGIVDAMVFTPKPSAMLGCSFNKWLNRLARKCEIRAADGNIWRFQSHQFRRTVATIMTNSGIRDLIIQKYLRHRSLGTQNHYKHILKQVLCDEMEVLMQEKKYVDITGKVVSTHRPTNPITEFIRRRLYQITTQYGECHRSVLKDACPTFNACQRCPSWRVSTEDLPYLKEDLKRVEEELEIAIRLGMLRQQQELERDRDILRHLISGLESNCD